MTGIILPPIALVGKAGAGKDTAAECLRELAGYQRFALADPLKDIAERLWGPDARASRYHLQNLGRKVREIDEDAWVNVLRSRIVDARLQNERAIIAGNAEPGELRPVVTDVRYPNEVDALREDGFVTVRVEADFHLRVARLQANGKLQRMEDLDDDSETALDGFPADFTVTNNTTADELAEDLAEVLNRMAL